MLDKICDIHVATIYISFYKALKFVYKNIIRIQAKFLWGWGSERRKISWVKWKKTCKSIEEGGLGIKDIEQFNMVMFVKWKWRLGMEKYKLWKEVIKSRYGLWRSMNENSRDQKLSWWWRDLSIVRWQRTQSNWFESILKWELGDGKLVKCWEDMWVGFEPLKDTFPRLYLIA